MDVVGEDFATTRKAKVTTNGAVDAVDGKTGSPESLFKYFNPDKKGLLL